MTAQLRHANRNRRRFILERLEDRMAPAVLSGLFWKDSLGGGTQNGGEPALGGVGIAVYRDGGDGIFNNGGGDDTLVDSTGTLPDGTFNSTVASDGRYFVLAAPGGPLTGLALTTGTNPRTADVVGGADVPNLNFGYQRQNPPPFVLPPGNDSTGNPYQPPGTFPVRASGAVLNAAPVPGSTLGGSGSDSVQVNFLASGPVAWTESRHNEGDISASIGPSQPGNPAYYPPASYLNYAPADGPGTYAWRLNKEVGLSFATVHANGFNNQDVLSGGGPVGTMYGTAYFNTDASSGNGYNMVDGTFRNGGNSQDLQMGLAGTPDEGTFSVATAFFPFLEGWAGGYVSNALPGPGGATLFDNGLATPGMTPAVANWLGDFSVGRANVNLTSFRSDFTPANGMLFVAPNSGNNNANIAASVPNGNGWDIAIREDNDLDTTGNTFAARTDSQFSFMYMDFRYAGLIGARIAGATGNTIHGAGAYTLTRLGTGTYALTIAGKVDTSGMLLLSGAGAQAGAPSLPSRAFFSYQYDAANSRFVIQARQLTTGGNPFGEDSPLVDADFNFAYVDFTNPVRPVIAPTVTGISVNGGAQQRSRVTTVDVSFSTIVTFAGPVANAFTFTHNGGGAVGGFSATANVVGGVTVVTLNNFTGAETEFGSLVDGRFTLTVLANQVSSGGVNMASNATFTDTNGLFRLFGDVNGDRTVNGLDLGFFRNAFGTSAGDPNYLSYLDFNGDGVINGFDLGQLRTRFGTVPP